MLLLRMILLTELLLITLDHSVLTLYQLLSTYPMITLHLIMIQCNASSYSSVVVEHSIVVGQGASLLPLFALLLILVIQ